MIYVWTANTKSKILFSKLKCQKNRVTIPMAYISDFNNCVYACVFIYFTNSFSMTAKKFNMIHHIKSIKWQNSAGAQDLIKPIKQKI